MDKYFKMKSVNEKESKSIMRQYSDSYILFGFTFIGDPTATIPLRVVYRKERSNSAMILAKMKRHLEANHPSLIDKITNYIVLLIKNNKKQVDFMKQSATVSERALKVSLLVAELVAKQKNPHAVAEKVILPACTIIVEMLCTDAVKEVAKLLFIRQYNSLSDKTIEDVSVDIEDNILEKVHISERFALQVEESTDINKNA